MGQCGVDTLRQDRVEWLLESVPQRGSGRSVAMRLRQVVRISSAIGWHERTRTSEGAFICVVLVMAMNLLLGLSCREQPREPDSPARRPPDLSSCTQLLIQLRPSTIEYLFPFSRQQDLLTADEKARLQSLETITVSDPKTIAQFARKVQEGSYKGPASAGIPIKNVIIITALRGTERLAQLVIRGPLVMDTDDGSRFEYDGVWPLQQMLPADVRELASRVEGKAH
jgi:hypothetical protein